MLCLLDIKDAFLVVDCFLQYFFQFLFVITGFQPPFNELCLLDRTFLTFSGCLWPVYLFSFSTYLFQPNNLGMGVVGVVKVDFLKPIHNKQDFEKDEKYK